MNFRNLVDKNKDRLRIKLEKELNRIKDGLAEETERTGEMVETYRRFTSGQATEMEMAKANRQFKSFLRTIGLGVLAILPFSPITIPVVVELGKKYGIDVLPDSFNKKP